MYKNEEGFSLLELVMAVSIAGIIALIVIPNFSNQVVNASNIKIKSELVEASLVLNSERLDNNGLYPTYTPNEIITNDVWKEFTYTYSSDRLVYCLSKHVDGNGDWYISNLYGREAYTPTPSTPACTQSNFGDGTKR